MEFFSGDNTDIVNKYDTNQISFVWRSDNVLHYYIKENAFITMDDIGEILEIVRDWGASNKYLHLFESGYNATVDTEVREWASSSNQNHYTVADAILVKNMAQRLIGNFYIRFNQPVKPTKLFTSKKEAIDWLLEQGEDYSVKHPEWSRQTIR